MALDPNVMQWVPFIGMMATKPSNSPPIVVRLMEAAIIAGITMFGTVEKLSERIAGMEKRYMDHIVSLTARVERIENQYIRPRADNLSNRVAQD